MKALFVWREESKNYILNIIKNQFSDEVRFIVSEVDFQGFISKGVSKSYTKIYILAELGWDNNDLFEGYKKGFQIIENWKSTNSPCIEFFSISNRKNIYNYVEDRLKFIVKAFSYTDLLEVTKKYKFNTSNINQFKWDSFKYMALTNYGILDNLSHRLDSIKESNTNFESKLNQLISELTSYSEFIGEEIIDTIKNIEHNNNFVYKLKQLIDNRISEIKGEKANKIELPTSLKILIIDDDIVDLLLIENSLKRYSNYLKTTTSGEEAMTLINEKDCVFDIIISDLELLDKDGFYQKTQGIEIFELVNKSEGSVIGIITGLGRKGIAKLLNINDKLILPKKHLHRFDVDEEIDNLLKNLLLQFKQKENRLNVLYGPNKGTYFGLTGFKTSLAKAFEIEDFKKETWKYAFNILNKFIDKNLKLTDWDKSLKKEKNKKVLNTDEFIEQKLKSLLAQRLILIFLSLKNNGVVLPNELEEEYSEILEINELNVNKGYINRISIPYNTKGLTEPTTNSKGKPDTKINGFRLEPRDLLPEELAYIKQYKKEKQQSDFLVYIKDNSPLTIEWLRTYFDFEEQWYSDFDVSFDLDVWTFEDLNKVCNILISDFNKNLQNSIYKETIESIINNLTRSIAAEIFPILPDLEQSLNKIGDLLIEIED